MEVILLKQARKNLEALDAVTRRRIKTGIYKLPAGDIKRLEGVAGRYRLRIGAYRILFRYQGNDLIVEDVLPRGNAYDRL